MPLCSAKSLNISYVELLKFTVTRRVVLTAAADPDVISALTGGA